MCKYDNWYRIQKKYHSFQSFNLHKKKLLHSRLLPVEKTKERIGILNKSLSDSSNQLLQEIDRKMSTIESMLILRYISGYVPTEEAYEVQQMLVEVSQLLLMLQQEPKMASLAKGLSLQLQTIQEEYNRIIG